MPAYRRACARSKLWSTHAADHILIYPPGGSEQQPEDQRERAPEPGLFVKLAPLRQGQLSLLPRIASAVASAANLCNESPVEKADSIGSWTCETHLGSDLVPLLLPRRSQQRANVNITLYRPRHCSMRRGGRNREPRQCVWRNPVWKVQKDAANSRALRQSHGALAPRWCRSPH